MTITATRPTDLPAFYEPNLRRGPLQEATIDYFLTADAPAADDLAAALLESTGQRLTEDNIVALLAKMVLTGDLAMTDSPAAVPSDAHQLVLALTEKGRSNG